MSSIYLVLVGCILSKKTLIAVALSIINLLFANIKISLYLFSISNPFLNSFLNNLLKASNSFFKFSPFFWKGNKQTSEIFSSTLVIPSFLNIIFN